MSRRVPNSNSEDFFNLRSNNIQTKLFENILVLDEFLDAILSVDGKTIKAHRIILAAGSEYFRSLLKKCDRYDAVPISK